MIKKILKMSGHHGFLLLRGRNDIKSSTTFLLFSFCNYTITDLATYGILLDLYHSLMMHAVFMVLALDQMIDLKFSILT